MKKIINWKTFFILLIACAVTSVLIIPYQVGLSPDLADMGAILYLGAFVQGAVMFSIVILFGLILARKVGFSLPILEDENKLENLKAILKPSILWGFAGAILLTPIALAFGKVSIELLASELAVPLWAKFFAIFYGGIAEEVLMRLFVVSLIAWVLIKIKVPRNASIWVAIVLSAVLFGLGHLPFTSALTAITADVVLRAILLNGIIGIIFGVLYWKKGLESAVIAHLSAGVVLRFVTPYVASLFIYL